MGSTPCTVQLELRPSAAAAGGVQPTVTVKNRRDEVETMPLFASKDTISGEVGRGCCGAELLAYIPLACAFAGRPRAACAPAAGPLRAARVGSTPALHAAGDLNPPCPHAAPTRPQVKVTPIPGKRADHQGIRIQLLGEVELASERGHPHQFLSLGGAHGQLGTHAAAAFNKGKSTG